MSELKQDDGKFRAINQSHQGTLGVEVKW